MIEPSAHAFGEESPKRKTKTKFKTLMLRIQSKNNMNDESMYTTYIYKLFVNTPNAYSDIMMLRVNSIVKGSFLVV